MPFGFGILPDKVLAMDIISFKYVSFSDRVYDNYKRRLSAFLKNLTSPRHGKRTLEAVYDKEQDKTKIALLTSDEIKDSEEASLACADGPIIKCNMSN